jgi:hypothetical protein
MTIKEHQKYFRLWLRLANEAVKRKDYRIASTQYAAAAYHRAVIQSVKETMAAR